MSCAVRILTPADSDAVEAALWYEAQVHGLGAEFLEEVNLAAQRLAQNPEIHRIRFADVRRAPVHRFKYYGLYYLIHEAEVWVIAVHHGRRHPHWLRDRRKHID
jgi:plasmid stabilization system protein ParE